MIGLAAKDRYPWSRYTLARDQADFKSRRRLGADALAERVRSGWVLGWADLAFLARSIRKALRLRARSAFPTSAEIFDLLVDTQAIKARRVLRPRYNWNRNRFDPSGPVRNSRK